MDGETLARGGPGAEWVSLFLKEGGETRLCEALGLQQPDTGGDAAVLAAANDLGLAIADIVKVDAPAPAKRRPGEEERPADLARQWQFSDGLDSTSFVAVIVPVAIDDTRSAYEPGQATLSLERLGDNLFMESICDLIALPLDGGLPLSLTGLSLAVGRFAVRERGEVEIFGSGMAWLNAHLQRARDHEAEFPTHLVAMQLEQPEHYCTLVLEPKAIEWRPAFAWCPLPRETKSLVVRDSMGLASFIGEAMKRKLKTPALPKIYGPKAGAA